MTSRSRRWLRPLLALAAFLAIAWSLRDLDPFGAARALFAADPLWVAAALLPLGARFAIWAFKWRRMLARRERVPYGFSLRTVLAGAAVNLTTPTAKLGGGVVRASMLKRHRGWPFAEAYGWTLADQATNLLGHAAVAGIVALAAASEISPGSGRTWLALAGFSVLVVVAAICAGRASIGRWLLRPGWSERWRRRLPERVGAAVREALGPLLGSATTPGQFASDVLLGAATPLLACAANALVLHALGSELPLGQAALAVVTGYAVGIALGVWGGIGVTEAALAAFLTRAGAPTETAIAAALVQRLLLYAGILAGGLWALTGELRRSEGPV